MKLSTATSVIALGLVAGCAVPTTGVVPRGDDMFTVTHQGAGAWVTPDQLKAEALREADGYCVSKSKKFKFIYSKEIPAGPLGRWPESEVLFKCD